MYVLCSVLCREVCVGICGCVYKIEKFITLSAPSEIASFREAISSSAAFEWRNAGARAPACEILNARIFNIELFVAFSPNKDFFFLKMKRWRSLARVPQRAKSPTYER
jgi:hypothetical protein